MLASAIMNQLTKFLGFISGLSRNVQKLDSTSQRPAKDGNSAENDQKLIMPGNAKVNHA